jgi:hypothetical protein
MFLKGVRESTLSASHGLQTGDWSGVFAAANPDVGTISIRTLAHGAFAEFVNATSNISLLTANSSKPNFAYPHPSIAVGTSISLNDLVSRIPEIGEQYTRWQGLPNFCPVDMQSSPPTADVRVNQKLHGLPVDRAFVESFFNTSTLVFQSDQNNQFWYKVSNKISDLPPLWDHRNQAFGIVGDYVLLKNFGGQQFSKASAILALAYVMGMLVRYYPSKWMSLVRNEIGDAGVPTILAAIDYVEETFPQSILEFFERDLLGV